MTWRNIAGMDVVAASEKIAYFIPTVNIKPMTNCGELFIVATPIGNLGDITLRALETLKQVDLIAAEDTRHSHKLLGHYNITTPTISLHNYNEAKKCDFLITQLQQGKNIALISDAGTPLISDPGYRLVTNVQQCGGKVIPIPGACAAIAALSVAGLPTDKFIFEGFLPAKSAAQLSRLQELAYEIRTMIFYVSPHRLLTTINNMQTIFGKERKAILAKELTKIFETIYSATLADLENWLMTDKRRQQGEFVILVTGHVQKIDMTPEVLRIFNLLAKNLPRKQALLLTTQITGVRKNQLYRVVAR